MSGDRKAKRWHPDDLARDKILRKRRTTGESEILKDILAGIRHSAKSGIDLDIRIRPWMWGGGVDIFIEGEGARPVKVAK